MKKLLQTVFFVLLISLTQVFAGPFWIRRGRNGYYGTNYGYHAVKIYGTRTKIAKSGYDGVAHLSCREGFVIAITKIRLINGWYVSYDHKLNGKIKIKCDGKETCMLNCEDDECLSEMKKQKMIIAYKCVPEPCSAYYCSNGGRCMVKSLKPTCECIGDWTGDRCDVSPCKGFEGCRPGQSCFVDTNAGTRKCCHNEVNPCKSVKCQNGGSCLIEYSSWTGRCCCKKGFIGEMCEIKVDACTDNPCANGGECKVGTKGEAQCTCAQNYAGPTCDVNCTEEITCPADTTTISVSGSKRCYFISDVSAESFLAAKAECANKGYTLWEPNTLAEKTAVVAVLGNHDYWTGATDMQTEGSTVFVGSGDVFSLTFTSTNTARKDCVEIQKSGSIFQYRDCTVVRRYICEQPLPCDKN